MSLGFKRLKSVQIFLHLLASIIIIIIIIIIITIITIITT